MNQKMNASKALMFLLKQEYQRFSVAWNKVQENLEKEGLIPEGKEKENPPSFEVWLETNEITEEQSNIVGLDGQKIKK